MKYIAIVAAAFVAIYSLSIAFADDAVPKQNLDQYSILKFNVANMTCKMCNITVRKSIERVIGVKHVVVSYDKKSATVVVDPKLSLVSEEKSISAIESATLNAGYPATFSPKPRLEK
jgi:copper chaperone CopZ